MSIFEFLMLLFFGVFIAAGSELHPFPVLWVVGACVSGGLLLSALREGK